MIGCPVGPHKRYKVRDVKGIRVLYQRGRHPMVFGDADDVWRLDRETNLTAVLANVWTFLRWWKSFGRKWTSVTMLTTTSTKTRPNLDRLTAVCCPHLLIAIRQTPAQSW